MMQEAIAAGVPKKKKRTKKNCKAMVEEHLRMQYEEFVLLRWLRTNGYTTRNLTDDGALQCFQGLRRAAALIVYVLELVPLLRPPRQARLVRCSHATLQTHLPVPRVNPLPFSLLHCRVVRRCAFGSARYWPCRSWTNLRPGPSA